MKSILKRPVFSHMASAVLACAMLATSMSSAQPASAAPQAPESTPIVGGTSFGGAAQISPDVEYSSSVSTSNTDDFFYVDAAPGQIATVDFTSTVTWNGQASFYLYDQLHINPLYNGGSILIQTTEQPGQYIHVGNNTTPTRYYFRVEGNGAAKDFLFKVMLANQADGGATGDAGDTSATARVIAPAVGTVSTFSGSTGGKDADDWYRINVAPGQRISVTSRILDYGVDSSNGGDVSLYDAANATNSIGTNTHFPSDLEPKTVEWMSNSTAPNAYLIRAQMGGTPTGAPLRYQLDVLLTDQTDGGPIGDAGDTAVTARVIAPTLGVLATYTGTTGQNDGDDWFRINAVSGMRISVTTTILNFGKDTTGFAELYDAADAANALVINSYNTAGAPQSFSYMSNNTTPAAYFIRMNNGTTGPGAALTYRFTVLTEQQSDANVAGDAGDDFDGARIISPTLDATTNLLGRGDKKDFYKVDLPIDPLSGLNVGAHFKFFVKPIAWPTGSSGSLIITKYDASRAQVGSPQSIQAPIVKALEVDFADCDLCYISVEDQTTGTKQFAYSFSLVKPLQVYLPIVRR